jgi:hypothetical protein
MTIARKSVSAVGLVSCALMVAVAPMAGADDIDTDGDGLTTQAEVYHRTNPSKPDTDGDGRSDGQEVVEMKTDPTKADTDGDGVSDGGDIAPLDPTKSRKRIGSKTPPAPSRPDGDGDGLFDDDESNVYRTDPGRQDTDSDGVTDGEEVYNKTDPLNFFSN